MTPFVRSLGSWLAVLFAAVPTIALARVPAIATLQATLQIGRPWNWGWALFWLALLFIGFFLLVGYGVGGWGPGRRDRI